MPPAAPNTVSQPMPAAAKAVAAQTFPWPQAADYVFRDEHRAPLPPGCGPLDGSDLLLAFGGSAPAWVDALMAARNQVVGRLGLKTGPMPATLQGPLHVGQYLGMFQVRHLGPDLALMGEDDSHLDFRIFVRVDRATVPAGGVAELVVSTWVRPHNWAGRAYLAVVWPFHWLISKVMVRRLAGLLGASAHNKPTTQP
ncbi:MAG: DUF2867 domain-containing protein [Burkholderiales bacterium]|nr:DUF2867 domain-containing protein [Burkholderiales bacterium]